MQKLLASILLVSISLFSFAQMTGGGGKGGMMNNPMMNNGHFYGKVIDSTTEKPVEFASVQLWGNKFDTVSKKMNYVILSGMITAANGDFSLENLPVMGDFSLKITFVGYEDYAQKVSFNINWNDMKGKDFSKMLNMMDKDLGNIKIKSITHSLDSVVVEANDAAMTLKFDKKVFNMSKLLTVTGGTAEDALKVVPSVNVDIDGNVTMRNSSPQIFVDGRPTTLTLNQIPADAIETVEIISNPSAKYDASGGQAGIINIVLKKERKNGYNGDIRAGMDQRLKLNFGGDINSRQGKTNVFLSGMINQNMSVMNGSTYRENYNVFGAVPSKINQTDKMTMNNLFGFARGGFDWFADNRNTLTFSGSYMSGSFSPNDVLHTSTEVFYPPFPFTSAYNRTSNTGRHFANVGGSFQFKHIFPKAEKELTADVNYNNAKYSGDGDYVTEYVDTSGNIIGNDLHMKYLGNGYNKMFTAQTDYANPIGKNKKIEGGLRASIKAFEVLSANSIFNDSTNDFETVVTPNANYKFNDQVYAAYGTFSDEVTKKLSFSVGLRFESSLYIGTLIDENKSLTHLYPLSIFPSGSATYSLKDNNDFSFSYSRRINRPNFFNLIPFTDYSDSLNLSRGNPDLKPEFTNSLELSFLHTIRNNNSFMASVWYKNTTGLIARYQVSEFDTVLNRTVVINTFQNASFANAYGLELTSNNTIRKWMTMMFNVNIYNSVINGSNIEASLTNSQFSYTAKANVTFKFLKSFSLQLTGDYKSRTAVPANRGGGGGDWGGMGGGMNGIGNNTSLTGYNLPVYGLDAGLKYKFLKNKMASLSINCSDIFSTNKKQSYSSTIYFTQTTQRLRDPHFFRISFMYNFGKFDTSLLKRKNMNMDNEGMQNVGGM